MSNTPAVRRWLRGVAIVIALAGVIDPAVTSMRTVKPVISVVPVAATRDSALAVRVARQLEREFVVVSAPFGNADATILAGTNVPARIGSLSSPVFAVLPPSGDPAVAIETVSAPPSASMADRVPVAADVHVAAAIGRTLDVSLRVGDLVVDHVTHTVASDEARVPLSLTFVPTAAGAVPLRVTAKLAGARDSASADLLVDVHDRRWQVLFFDPRPSWMSTFVRRTIERDARFVVTSRIVTSRNVSASAGQPPGQLDDLAGVSRFDVIVAGAPESLNERDVAGLERFMRRRGGGVVLLFDQRARGRVDRLIGVDAWKTVARSAGAPVAVTSADSATLHSSELAWPSSMPRGADIIAQAQLNDADAAAGLRRLPVVWRLPQGSGQLIVSGALDAWRYRDRRREGEGDRSRSAFDHFWLSTIAQLASAAPQPLTIATSRGQLAPGERAELSASIRDAALAWSGSDSAGVRPVRAQLSAMLESSDDSSMAVHRTPVRLWANGAPGQFEGVLRAAPRPGSYRLVLSGDGNRAGIPVIVDSHVATATPEDRQLLRTWVAARGGQVFEDSPRSQLAAALGVAIRRVPRLETWHPMRSPWWILPFALALSAEWWLRRRRALP